jgi:hypothetical protein
MIDWQIIAQCLVPLVLALAVYGYKSDQNRIKDKIQNTDEKRQNLEKRFDEFCAELKSPRHHIKSGFPPSRK